MRPVWLTMTACVLGACGGAERAGRAERLVVGDTTIVRTLEGSVWGDSVSLVEELSIGALNGPPEYEFGQVQDVAVDANGACMSSTDRSPPFAPSIRPDATCESWAARERVRASIRTPR